MATIRTLFKFISTTVFLSLVTANTFALDLQISRPQIQLLLNSVFPHQQALGQWQVEFSEPVPSFQASAQKISLGVQLKVQDQQRTANASGTIGGQLFFNAQTQELQIVKPSLSAFKIISGDPVLSKQLQDGLAQQVGQHLPLIVLFDIKKLMGNTSFIQPQAVNVVDDGLLIRF